jgi:hypothetical protein
MRVVSVVRARQGWLARTTASLARAVVCLDRPANFTPRARAAAAMVTLACLATAATVHAQVDEERLRLMHETIAYTDVIDAFDGQDRFDLNVQLEYARLRDTGKVYRERTLADGTRTAVPVARSVREVSQLSLGVDVGLLRDVMASVRLPLILSESRRLELADGVSAEQARARLTDGEGADSPLFALPFAAPTRAGLDYLAIGGAWAVLNQMRRSWLPTWVVRLEGRRAVGAPQQACRRSAGKDACGSESAEDRDGDGRSDGTYSQSARAGSSRGMSGLLAETRFSRRLRRAEPYAGLSLLISWPALHSAARDAFQPGGYGRARPGPESAATLGLALIPWEDRGSWQRLVLDARLSATHVGRGTEYSALYDALGTSPDPALASPRGAVDFRGITEVEAHLRYGGQLSVEVQAARYVRFAIGSWLQWVTRHALSGRDPCAGPRREGELAAADARVCEAGRPDARERGVIDAPGRRFQLRDQLLLGVHAQATATF